MRVKISDKNIFPSFSIRNEYIKLQSLFEDETVFGRTYEYADNDDPSMSYEYCLQYMFLNWKLRGTFTSLDEMKAQLQQLN